MSATRAKDLMMITIDKAIDLYLATLETEGKSPRYIGWLRPRLLYFNVYIQRTNTDITKLQDLTVDDGRDYLRYLLQRRTLYENHPNHKEKEGKLKTHYIHGLGRAIRSFSTWAYEEGYLEENVMRRLKLPQLPKILPEPLRPDEIERVLSVALDRTLERLRNFAIVMIFLDTGIRLDELVNLKLSKVDFTIGEMTVFGKGSKERKVPIGTNSKKALIEYLTRERPEPVNPHDEDYLFLSADGVSLTRNTVEQMFRRIKIAANVPNFHPHACRHTFSVQYLVNGGDAFSLQKILGHTSLEMTRKYVNLASGDVKEKHRRFSPMDNLNFRAIRRGRPKMRQQE